MALGLESLTSELDKKETAFQSLPQSELMKKRKAARTGGLPPSLTEALVAEKVLNDKAAAANAMSASMQSDPRTVAQQNEAELQNKTQQEVLQATAGVLQNKARMVNKNMQRMRNQGITRAPVQRRQVMAQGGIVGYQDGGFLDRFKDKETGLYHPGPHMFDSLGQSVYDYVTKNPLGALGYGLLGATSLNPIRAGAGALYKGAQKLGGTKVGKKGIDALTNLFTKRTVQQPKGIKVPKGNTLPVSKQQVAIPRTVARPGAVAGVGGLGLLMGSQLLKSDEEEPIVPTTDETKRFETAEQLKKPEATPSAGKSQADRDAARDRFVYKSAGRSGRERIDRGRTYDLQEFTNKIEQDTLLAKKELNKITKTSQNYQMLQNRLTQVNAEIAKYQEQLALSPIGEELRAAQQEALDDPEDANKQETVRLLEIKYARELERLADPMGTGDVGLLVQRKELQEKLRGFTDTMGGSGFTVKQIS